MDKRVRNAGYGIAVLFGLVVLVLSARSPAPSSSGDADVPVIAAQIDGQLDVVAERARGRVDGLVALPRMAWAVSTDAATVHDMTVEELALTPRAGETIEIAQWDIAQSRSARLLRVPEGASGPAIPIEQVGEHFLSSKEGIFIVVVKAIEARQRPDQVRGLLGVAERWDPSAVEQRLAASGAKLRIEGASGDTAWGAPAAVGATAERTVVVPLRTAAAPGSRLVFTLGGVHGSSSSRRGLLIPLGLVLILGAAIAFWRDQRAQAARSGPRTPRAEVETPVVAAATSALASAASATSNPAAPAAVIARPPSSTAAGPAAPASGGTAALPLSTVVAPAAPAAAARASTAGLASVSGAVSARVPVASVVVAPAGPASAPGSAAASVASKATRASGTVSEIPIPLNDRSTPIAPSAVVEPLAVAESSRSAHSLDLPVPRMTLLRPLAPATERSGSVGRAPASTPSAADAASHVPAPTLSGAGAVPAAAAVRASASGTTSASVRATMPPFSVESGHADVPIDDRGSERITSSTVLGDEMQGQPAVIGDDEWGQTTPHVAEVLKRLYDEFLALRHTCGERADNIDYERFVATLRRHRRELIERHKFKEVTFRIAFNDGRAIVRSTGIR